MFILSISRAFMPGYSMLACLDNFEPRTVINRVNFARKSIFRDGVRASDLAWYSIRPILLFVLTILGA